MAAQISYPLGLGSQVSDHRITWFCSTLGVAVQKTLNLVDDHREMSSHGRKGWQQGQRQEGFLPRPCHTLPRKARMDWGQRCLGLIPLDGWVTRFRAPALSVYTSSVSCCVNITAPGAGGMGEKQGEGPLDCLFPFLGGLGDQIRLENRSTARAPSARPARICVSRS